jgi:hypothetical protein
MPRLTPAQVFASASAALCIRTRYNEIMFSSWHGRVAYLIFAALALGLTARLTRPGLEETLNRPIVRGFGPPCSLWQAWKLFCGFFWEQMLLAGVVVSCSIRVALGQWHPTDLLIAAGVVVVFPFQEYLSHKYLLHRPPKVLNRSRESLVALVHRAHHRDPWHMERAINPPVAVILYAVGLPVIFFPLLARPQAMTGVAASWLVLLWYEWVHLLIHTSHVPRNALFKRIWRNHRLHHFKNEHFWYNVSTYGVDSLLHTKPHPASVPTSQSCLTLDDSEANVSYTDDPIAIRTDDT